jgi:hypothetical protein
MACEFRGVDGVYNLMYCISKEIVLDIYELLQ